MPLIIGAKSASAATGVANSCRFNPADSAYLTRTPASNGSETISTLSMWFKRSGLLAQESLYFNSSDSNNKMIIRFNADATFDVRGKVAGSFPLDFETNRLFRDPGAWMHFVFKFDTTQATEADRFKMYVNGVQETSFSTETYPAQDTNLSMNQTDDQAWICAESGSGAYSNGYLAEVVFCDGQAYDASDFGEFDEDSPTIWKPKSADDISGLTFGTNGFYLNFEDSADLGADASGNSNDLTATNLDATDQATDTPANNFCTINSIVGLQGNSSDTVFSQGNTTVVGTGPASNEWRAYYGTMGVSSGKWYWEVECTNSWGAGICQRHGICDVNQLVQQEDESSTDLSRAWGWRNPGGYRNNNTDTDDASYGSYTTGDILQFALDLDNNKLYFGKDGTWEDSGDPTSGATGTGAVSITAGYTYTPLDERLYGSDKYSANFGNPGFTVSSGNADGNGYGNFEYAVPSGYYALCTKNLAEYG